MTSPMKDSGVDWIGKIPEEWKITPNKYLMKKVKDICKRYTGETILSLTLNGVVVRNLGNGGKMPSSFDGYQFVYPSNLLMCLFDYDVTPRCIGLINTHGITSPAYSQFVVVGDNSSRYYCYLYLAMDNDKILLSYCKNLRHSLTEEQLGGIRVVQPPIAEQLQIADFLDKTCNEIDKLSTDIQSQIDKLAEYKKSIITHAVTKGLDPNAQMKDSGVGWIGKIPEGWTTTRIKYLADTEQKDSFVDGDWIESPFITESGIRYLTTGNIGDGIFKRQGDGYISIQSFEALHCKLAYPGDLVISRLNEEYGRSCILPNDENKYVLAVDNVILRSKSNLKYLCYCTQSPAYHESVRNYSYGTTMKRVSRTNLGNIIMPLPPLNEQGRIADYLDNKCSNIDDIIEIKKKQLDKLAEYKKSIIYEYTTGKKRIKE